MGIQTKMIDLVYRLLVMNKLPSFMLFSVSEEMVSVVLDTQ